MEMNDPRKLNSPKGQEPEEAGQGFESAPTQGASRNQPVRPPASASPENSQTPSSHYDTEEPSHNHDTEEPSYNSESEFSENVSRFSGGVKEQMGTFAEHLKPLKESLVRFFSSSILSFTQIRLNTVSNLFIAIFTILMTGFTYPLVVRANAGAQLIDAFETLDSFANTNVSQGLSYGSLMLKTWLFGLILYLVAFALTYFGANFAKDPYNSSQVAFERLNFSLFPYMLLLPFALIFGFFWPHVSSFLMIFGLLVSLIIYSYLWMRSTEQQRDRRFWTLIGNLAFIQILGFLFFRFWLY